MNEMFWLAVLSQAVVDAGAVPLLVLCLQEPEMPLKRIAASALSDICKHSSEVIANLHNKYDTNFWLQATTDSR